MSEILNLQQIVGDQQVNAQEAKDLNKALDDITKIPRINQNIQSHSEKTNQLTGKKQDIITSIDSKFSDKLDFHMLGKILDGVVAYLCTEQSLQFGNVQKIKTLVDNLRIYNQELHLGINHNFFSNLGTYFDQESKFFVMLSSQKITYEQYSQHLLTVAKTLSTPLSVDVISSKPTLENKVAEILNSSEIISGYFFEKTTEEEFNAVFDEIYKDLDSQHTISSSAEGKDLQFYKMVADYAKPSLIWDDQIVLSKDDGKEYKKGTNLVKFFVAEPITKEEFKDGESGYKQDGDKYYKKSSKESVFLRGSQNHVQESRAESVNANSAKESFKKKPDFNLLDEKGTYKTFEKVIKEDPSFLKNNLPTIMNQLKLYKPEATTADFKELVSIKNGYADVLTNAIVDSKDSELIKSYLTYLSPENAVYLGNDKATQTKNFNLLVSSPLYKQVEATLDPTIKNNLLNLRLSIDHMNQKSFQESIKSGMDSLIKTFGPMLLSIVEFFGGKGSLKKFCSKSGIDYDKYFDQFEKLYKDEYALDKGQSTFLKDVFAGKSSTWEGNAEDQDIRDAKGNIIPYNKKAIQTSYKSDFSKDGHIDKDKFLLLDPQLVAKTMKDKNYTNSDVVSLVKDGGKEKWVINPNNSLTDAQMDGIVSTLVEDPSIWKGIQSAGLSMASDAVYSADATKDPVGNKQAEQMKQMKGLTTAQDIGIYFGLYLMKGSKDLKYAVSENDLPNKDQKDKEINNELSQKKEKEQIEKEYSDFIAKLSTGEWKDLPKVAEKGKSLSPEEEKLNKIYKEGLVTYFDKILKTGSRFLSLSDNKTEKITIKQHLLTYFESKMSIKENQSESNKSNHEKIKSISGPISAKIEDGVMTLSGESQNKTPVEVPLSSLSWLGS